MGEIISIHQAVKRRQQLEYPLGVENKLMVENAVAPSIVDVGQAVPDGLVFQ